MPVTPNKCPSCGAVPRLYTFSPGDNADNGYLIRFECVCGNKTNDFPLEQHAELLQQWPGDETTVQD